MNTGLNPRLRTAGGFTLIEILITIVIVAVLASLAGPSFREYVAIQRIKNASFELVSALSFTRSEAIKRNAAVALATSSTASPKNWAQGWAISIGGTELRRQDVYTGVVIKATNPADSSDVGTLTYANDGRPTTRIQFNITLPSAISGVKPRCVSMDLSGVPKSTVGACS